MLGVAEMSCKESTDPGPLAGSPFPWFLITEMSSALELGWRGYDEARCDWGTAGKSS